MQNLNRLDAHLMWQTRNASAIIQPSQANALGRRVWRPRPGAIYKKEENAMNMKNIKTFDRNSRPAAAAGLSTGFPNAPGGAGFTVLQDKVIIIADKPTALRMLSCCNDTSTLPQ